jgi:hypothetical protein
MLAAGALTKRRDAVERRDPSLSHYRFVTPSPQPTSADAFPGGRWQLQGRRRPGARPSGTVVARRSQRVNSYFHSSSVFGRCPEQVKIYLVTMAALCYFIVAQGSDCRSNPFTHSGNVVRGGVLDLLGVVCREFNHRQPHCSLPFE